jgi:hypothetical protein
MRTNFGKKCSKFWHTCHRRSSLQSPHAVIRRVLNPCVTAEGVPALHFVKIHLPKSKVQGTEILPSQEGHGGCLVGVVKRKRPPPWR